MTYLLPIYFLFFFFQAEDGIRDYRVTGVQTCALPICLRDPGRDPGPAQDRPPQCPEPESRREARRGPRGGPPPLRSEERRVGKACWIEGMQALVEDNDKKGKRWKDRRALKEWTASSAQ